MIAGVGSGVGGNVSVSVSVGIGVRVRDGADVNVVVGAGVGAGGKIPQATTAAHVTRYARTKGAFLSIGGTSFPRIGQLGGPSALTSE